MCMQHACACANVNTGIHALASDVSTSCTLAHQPAVSRIVPGGTNRTNRTCISHSSCCVEPIDDGSDVLSESPYKLETCNISYDGAVAGTTSRTSLMGSIINVACGEGFVKIETGSRQGECEPDDNKRQVQVCMAPPEREPFKPPNWAGESETSANRVFECVRACA